MQASQMDSKHTKTQTLMPRDINYMICHDAHKCVIHNNAFKIRESAKGVGVSCPD